MAAKVPNLAVIVCALALLSSAASAQEQPSASLFASRCGFCHATSGSAGEGPNLVERAPADYNAFAQTVRSGRSGRDSDMPAFSEGTLSDAELRAIHTYLMSLRARAN